MPEIKDLLEQQKKAFADFRTANDERLDQLEAKGNTDPLLEEKVNKANAELTKLANQLIEVEKKLNRAGGTGEDIDPDQAEYKDAFSAFMRKGNETGLAEKALNVGTDADGGYAVPEELDRNILQLMHDVSPLRRLCTVVQIGGATYKKLVGVGAAASGWVGEAAARTETTTPQLAELTPFMGEIYANPAATQQMLDDVFFNAEGWLSGEVSREFAEKEGLAFLSGTGTNQPKGILAYTSVATGDAARAFGSLQHKVAASATAITGDEMIDLIYMLKSGHRNGANFMMNGVTVAAVRKLKDSNGQYLWAPGLQAGQPSSLLGYPVEENEDMDDIATGNVATMFGNFRNGYMIVDRMGIRVLRDPYTHKPYVHFYSTKRVGGMLTDSNAIKLLQQA